MTPKMTPLFSPDKSAETSDPTPPSSQRNIQNVQ